MAGDQKGELTKDEMSYMKAQLQQKMRASLDKFRQEIRQELQQAFGMGHEFRSIERRQRRDHEGKSNHRNKFSDQKLKIPPFHGKADPASYVEWEKKMELIFSCQHYAERKKVQMATTEFCGYASSWWNQLVKYRRLDGREPVQTWHKLRALMRREYVPRQYHKEILQKQQETKLYPSDSVQKQPDSKGSRQSSTFGSSSKAVTCFSKEKTNKHSWFSEEDIKKLSQEIRDVLKQHKETNNTRPSLEEKNQESITSVSELKVEEPDLAAPIQEVQTETSKEKEKSETKQECSLLLPQSEFNFSNSFDELTCLVPVKPSRIVSVSQVAKEDSTEIEPEQSTQGEQLEQLNSLQPNTTLAPLSYDLQEHCKEFNMVPFVPEMFVKVSTEDIKRFGLDKVKDFCVSNSVFENMFKSFTEIEPDKLFDQKYFYCGNKNFSGHVLSFKKIMNHHEKILEPVFKPTDFCFGKHCDSLARTEEKSFVVNFPRHKPVTNDYLASAYVLKEPRKLQEPRLHQSDIRFEIVKFATISEFEIDCLCAENDSKHLGLFFEDILVYNTFFDKPTAHLKIEFTDSECVNLILDDMWVCNIFFDMHNRWINHTVLCFGDILVYNTFFDMMTHLICPKQAEKGTGEKRRYSDQSFKDESLDKLEMQQANLENCLAASFDIGAVRGSYLNNPRELNNKLDCYGNLTLQGLTSNWIHVQSFLEPCADYDEALKYTRRKNKCEEDKRFKPPDLNQKRHQDVTCFILIKEAPPDAAYKPKPSRNKFGIRLLLFDNILCANLFCFNVSGERRAKWISPFYISDPVSNNAYQRGLQGKADLRTNLFEEGGDDVIMESIKEWKHEPEHEELVADVIMESIKEWKHEPEHEELVAEDATRRIHWSWPELKHSRHYHHHSSHPTTKMIIK